MFWQSAKLNPELIFIFQAENAELHEQLNEAVDANVAQAEKVIRLEIMEEEYRAKLEQFQEIRYVKIAVEWKEMAGALGLSSAL